MSKERMEVHDLLKHYTWETQTQGSRHSLAVVASHSPTQRHGPAIESTGWVQLWQRLMHCDLLEQHRLIGFGGRSAEAVYG